MSEGSGGFVVGGGTGRVEFGRGALAQSQCRIEAHGWITTSWKRSCFIKSLILLSDETHLQTPHDGCCCLRRWAVIYETWLWHKLRGDLCLFPRSSLIWQTFADTMISAVTIIACPSLGTLCCFFYGLFWRPCCVRFFYIFLSKNNHMESRSSTGLQSLCPSVSLFDSNLCSPPWSRTSSPWGTSQCFSYGFEPLDGNKVKIGTMQR